jgi:hypothetical protein
MAGVCTKASVRRTVANARSAVGDASDELTVVAVLVEEGDDASDEAALVGAGIAGRQGGEEPELI